MDAAAAEGRKTDSELNGQAARHVRHGPQWLDIGSRLGPFGVGQSCLSTLGEGRKKEREIEPAVTHLSQREGRLDIVGRKGYMLGQRLAQKSGWV